MKKSITVGHIGGTPKERRQNPVREIHLGPLQYLVNKYQGDNDIKDVVYRLSYAGKHIYIKGRSLVGSLVMFMNGFNVFNEESNASKNNFYYHMYKHILSTDTASRFRVKVIAAIDNNCDHYMLLKEEQSILDQDRYNPNCLNNQMEAYIPKYNESTNMHGWFPRSAVMNFQKWLQSQERKDLLRQYKK